MDPLETTSKNDKCFYCRANKFMIDQVRETIKDIQYQARNENSLLLSKLASQNSEIESLKNHCTHLEETIAYLK